VVLEIVNAALKAKTKAIKFEAKARGLKDYICAWVVQGQEYGLVSVFTLFPFALLGPHFHIMSWAPSLRRQTVHGRLIGIRGVRERRGGTEEEGKERECAAVVESK